MRTAIVAEQIQKKKEKRRRVKNKVDFWTHLYKGS